MYEALTAMVFKSKICQNNIRDVMRPKTPLQMQGTTRHWDQGEEKDKEDLIMVWILVGGEFAFYKYWETRWILLPCFTFSNLMIELVADDQILKDV